MSNIAIKGAATGTGVFTLESPATNTNRTLTLPDEAGTVLTSASLITSAQLTGDAVPIGVGQTWQNVTASRAKSTTYYNTTGKPIMLCVKMGNTTGGDVAGYVDGVLILGMSFGTVPIYPFITFIVPSGASYSVTNNVSGFTPWFELR
tara:strand:- start:361 stop:804 length:444 start_codon:yes stop_codon:yes gene_type:complete